ncbi:winged helix-turn-helix domain-containing protein [Nocardiopsis aegyptia]|uniref:DNA-binding MarR family transcriptional regulator n=1 Tax=Nocardiopsis aegyptia TaxID=220378 RepID=A0A7Z0JDG6_9ACTN|nr:helix-turn-helix domain-containing protein [Nocardiopsis aegyptia]NYJ37474.1 DNA-binding MarR family transcriptional regulator [Nocardiopsis aegyptia]
MQHDPRDTDAEPGPERPRPMEVDARALRGLAHPLRGRLLDELGRGGPATATLLGHRLGESSGSTSYHLRQLSRYGFIEEDPGHSGGRERWWRVRPGGWSVAGREFLRDPETRQAAAVVLHRYFRERRESFDVWNAYAQARPEAPAVRTWGSAAGDSVSRLRMTAQEAEEFRLELMDVVRAMSARYLGRTSETHPGTESVQLQTALFPELAEARAWARDTAEGAGGGGDAGITESSGTGVDGPGGEPDR